jgi:hypothetical protein
MQPPVPQRITKINRPGSTRKNKPNQTQFLAHRTTYDIRHTTYGIYSPASAQIPNVHSRADIELSAPNALYEIRFTRYEIRNSSPAFSQPPSSQRFVCADLFPIIYLGGFHRSIVRYPPLMREWPSTDWTARRSMRPSIDTAC